ncbi:50S ribosomal protein L18e [archaeon]
MLRKEVIDMAEKEKKTKFEKNLKKLVTKSRSGRAEVNVGKIGKLTKKGETIVVPGKVLGTGAIDHAVTVAAMRFSESAKKKIEAAGGKAVAITDVDKKARVVA